KTSFDLKVENLLQEIILFINPLPFLLLIFGVALFFKTAKKRNRYYLIVSGILTFVLYGNVVFYRFYSDFITLPVLFQTSNFGDLGNSITTLISLKDIWYATGFLIIYITLKKIHSAKEFQLIKKEERRTYFIFSVAVLCFNLGLAEIERPQLLTRSFDREILVKSIGTFDYHLYDAFVQSKSHAQRVLADGSELTEVSNYVKSNQAEPNPSYFGLAKDRNVIIISLESMQNFVINNQVKGQTITPFLNELTKDPDTFYFDEFYHQTGLGKTSDAEFIVENSMYGTGRGAVFFTNAGNTFESMASRLNDTGYYTSVMHANNKSFWNRDLMYESLHIKKFFDVA
ncbi:MAG: LTA synthase family protein, partial [Kurthia sp.]|nr:LTA synthase family protein [Kurthia sp.]